MRVFKSLEQRLYPRKRTQKTIDLYFSEEMGINSKRDEKERRSSCRGCIESAETHKPRVYVEREELWGE